MTEEFNKWWDSDAVTRDASCGRWDADNIPKNNPYSVDTPAFWAWEGWQAGVGAEREACAKVLDRMAENDKLSNYFKVAALAIRARGQS